MKKIFIFALASIATLVSCQKENIQNMTVPNEPVVFTASIAQDDTKATIDIAGSAAKILWEAADKITITDAASHVATYKLRTGAGKKTATFEFDGGTALDAGSTYTATFGQAPSTTLSQPYSGKSVPVYMTAPSTSDPDNLRFTVQGGVLELTLTKSAEQAMKIVISNASGSYTLACTSPVNLSSGATFYMNLPQGTYTAMAVYDGNCRVAERTGLNIVIKENTLLPASTSDLTFNTIPGALPGIFPIDKNGNWVHFSKGNLYYDGSNWNLENNQYDYRTYAGNNSCIDGTKSDNGTPTGHWGTFGWVGTSGTLAPYGISDSTANSDYGNVAKESLKSDWGSAVGRPWRTLTKVEWEYLLSMRAAAADKIGHSTVCGVEGLIILPDTFTDPMTNVGSEAFVPASATDCARTGYDQNIYTAGGNWTSMETAGAVFLPAAGFREGNAMIDVGVSGKYWSSSLNSSEFAQLVSFDPDDVTGGSEYRYVGLSVRIVTE